MGLRFEKQDMYVCTMSNMQENTIYYWLKRRCFVYLIERTDKALYLVSSEGILWAMAPSYIGLLITRNAKPAVRRYFRRLLKETRAQMDEVKARVLSKMPNAGIKLTHYGLTEETQREGDAITEQVRNCYVKPTQSSLEKACAVLQTLVQDYYAFNNAQYAVAFLTTEIVQSQIHIRMRTNKNELYNNGKPIDSIALLMYNAFIRAKMTATYRVTDINPERGIIEEEVTFPVYLGIMVRRMHDALIDIYAGKTGATADDANERTDRTSDSADCDNDSRRSDASGDNGCGLVSLCDGLVVAAGGAADAKLYASS